MSQTIALNVSASAAKVTSIVTSGPGITNGNGDLNIGKVVSLAANFSAPVTVNTSAGSPTLILNNGAIGVYSGGSGTAALSFTYTVAAGQDTSDLTVLSLSLNGATIRDSGGNNADLSGATNFNPAGTLQIDTTPPAVTEQLKNDTGTSATDKITSDPTVTGSGDPNAVVHFIVDGSSIAATATATSTGAWTFTPMGLADGSHTIVASETDAAGNTGSVSLTFTLDTTAPAVTEVLKNDTGTSATDKITSDPTVTGSGDPNAVVHFTVDASSIAATATAASNGAWTFTPIGLADGSHTIVASETDAAGNTGSASLTFTLDTTAPAVTEQLKNDTGTSATDKVTSDPTVTGSGDPNAVVSFAIDGVERSCAPPRRMAPAPGPSRRWGSPTAVTPLWRARPMPAGNTGSVVAHLHARHHAAGSDGAAEERYRHIGHRQDHLRPDGHRLGRPECGGAFHRGRKQHRRDRDRERHGAWTFTPTGWRTGVTPIAASETDAAGNTGSASLTFTLDTTAPAVTEVLKNDTGTSATDKVTSDPTLTGSGEPNAVVSFAD